jgi:sRNA-binding carbon storage regulator CsrA
MLVLGRKPEQEIVLTVWGPAVIKVKHCGFDGGNTQIGIEADPELVTVERGEIAGKGAKP